MALHLFSNRKGGGDIPGHKEPQSCAHKAESNGKAWNVGRNAPQSSQAGVKERWVCAEIRRLLGPRGRREGSPKERVRDGEHRSSWAKNPLIQLP